MDPAVAGIAGAALAGGVSLVGSLFGGRREQIRDLWAENRLRADDATQLRKELDTERQLRQAAEDRTRAELAASEERCRQTLAEQEARCQQQIQLLESRVAGLGGA